MKLFKKKESSPVTAYEGCRAVIKSSICTGEKVAGFVDKSGKFEDIMLITGDSDLDAFCRRYGVNKEELGHIW